MDYICKDCGDIVSGASDVWVCFGCHKTYGLTNNGVTGPNEVLEPDCNPLCDRDD